jgi:outer membrane immunogenic protein
MKAILLAAVAASTLGFAIPATAADMPARVYTKAPPAMAPVFSWAGFYVGAHVGYAWGDEHDNLSDTLTTLGDKFDIDGVIGGVHAGYNWQAGATLFGIEGDFDGSGIKGSFFPVDADLQQFLGRDGTLSFKSHWQASLRARLGVVTGNWLLYATGGVAFADVKSNLDFLDCEGSCVFKEDSHVLVGWTAGGGVEHAFSPNWIGRVEARYTDFGSKSFNYNDSIPEATRVKFNITSVTAGLSYKF